MCFLNKRPIFSHIFVLVRYANVYSDRNCYYTLLDIATEEGSYPDTTLEQ